MTLLLLTSQARTNQSAVAVPGYSLWLMAGFRLLVQTPRRTHGRAVSHDFVTGPSSASSSYVRFYRIMWHAVIMARDQSTENNHIMYPITK